ncbi:PQQ-binding-like beta-propeller repeat protein [Desulfofarcimen acetoxidans]|uniref:outer membrane protein assembly factor BamB family protein n=1 Tax=Desulfofarcimen acetoxidans TaxID=58138 RepID=UPI0005A97D07|nr:PQQ-binding-like beta-propeller repeat protein [Desulfofarcimen acetoxidans]
MNRMLCRFLLLGIFLLLFTWGVDRAQAAVGGDWLQFQGNEQRVGQIDVTSPVLTPRLAWSKYVSNQGGTGVENTAVIDGDFVYVFACNKLLALSRTTGDTLWEQNLGDHGPLQISTPACGGGKIFLATFNGYVMAFDAKEGERLWSSKISQRGFQCPVTYADGFIYVGDGGTGGETNSYYCLDESGKLCWTYTSSTGGYLWCGCSVIDNYVVFGNLEGVVTSVYRDTGSVSDRVYLSDAARLSFARAIPGRIRSSVAYRDGYIYTSSENSNTEGYLWKIGFDQGSGQFINDGFSTATGFSTSTPVVYDGRVYVGQGEHGCAGSLVCVDDTGGEILWSYPVESGVKSSPALMVNEGGVYIYVTTATPDGYLYCLSGDGKLVWKYNLPDAGYVMQGPAVADGCLYQGTSGGYLYCLQEEREWPCFQGDTVNSGIASGSAPVQSPGVDWQAFTHYRATHGIDHPAMLANGKVFVVDAEDYAWAFDQATGQTLWSTQLDETPVRFNMPTPAYGEGKVFVATCQGCIYALDENSGQILWSGKLTHGSYQNEELSTQVLYSEGKVYVGSYEGNYYCLDASGQDGNPRIIWKYSGNANYQWWSGAAVAGDYLLFGDAKSVVAAVYKNTGVKAGEVNLSGSYGISAGQICSAVNFNWLQKKIYLTSNKGYVWCLGFDPLTGKFDTGTGWYKSIGNSSNSTPSVYDGKVYACSGSFNKPGGLYCLSAADGSLLWQHDFGSYGTEASPVIAVQNGKPYIYISTDCLTASAYCFDEQGNILWDFCPDHTEYTLAGVSIAGGRVFFVNDAGYVYALREQSEADLSCDLNGDSKVDVMDLILVGQHFGETGTPAWCNEDINKDGNVDMLDMVLIGQHWTA